MIWTESGTGFGNLPAAGTFYCMLGPKHAEGIYSEARALAIAGAELAVRQNAAGVAEHGQGWTDDMFMTAAILARTSAMPDRARHAPPRGIRHIAGPRSSHSTNSTGSTSRDRF